MDRQTKGMVIERRNKNSLKQYKAGRKNSEAANQLISYYSNNKDRMRYQDFAKTGCGIIGSGAIESAHRTLVQKRMKQSGQRWSWKGAQHMLNLRVVRKNNDWNKIIELSKATSKVAA